MSVSSRSPEPGDRRPPSDHPPGPSTPAAGEPEQQRPARPPLTFNRERFLLRLVALVLIAEVSLYAFGAGVCAWRGAQQQVPQGGLCARFDNAVHTAFGVALNTLLALLGGKALSGSERPPGP